VARTIAPTIGYANSRLRFLGGIGRAWRSSGLPLFYLRNELVARHCNRIPPLARIPAPRHQFIFCKVFDDRFQTTNRVASLFPIFSGELAVNSWRFSKEK